MAKKKIFILDDDTVALYSLKDLLVMSGFEVEVSQGAKDVLEKLKDFHPDLILLDLLMPNLGGLEVCEMLDNDSQLRNVPVIVVSGLVDEADIKKAYRLGVVGYITKPYSIEKMLHEINRAITSKENRIE